ncbi:MAG TPA: phage holin family protein [Methylovirgula sp.]
MMDFLTRQVRTIVSGAVTPVEAAGNRFVGRLVQTAGVAGVAVVALIAMLICLSIALDIWLTDIASPIIAALGVAGFYFVVAVICLLLLLARGSAQTKAAAVQQRVVEAAAVKADSRLSANIEDTVGPFVEILRQTGLKREEVAVRLAAEATKQMGPISLIGLALTVGFLCERAIDTRRMPK